MSMHRLFVAIPIAEELQAEIGDWRAQYRHWPVRWLAGKNLHITLAPPWEADDIEPAKTALESFCYEGKPFALAFRRVCFGPNLREPRLIWAEGQAPQEFLDIRERVSRLLNQPLDGRPFRLHLTLARFRPQDFVRFPMKRLDEAVSWRQAAGSIVLMESHLLPTGAEYEVLARAPLSLSPSAYEKLFKSRQSAGETGVPHAGRLSHS